MKKSLIVLAMMAALGAHAQDTTTVNTGAQSGSTSGANSGSVSGVQSSNSGNTSVSAIGNQAGAQSGSQSSSGSSSGSLSGALGNVVNIDQSGPTSQTINSTGKSDANVHYSGSVRNENVSSGTTTNRIEYSGTQTVKNVPGIAMSGPASGPCTGASGGVGVAGPGFGVGLNGAKVDDGCTVRENTRILGQLFQSLDAANPAKAEAQAALLEGMAIIRNMNAKIGGDYAPKPEPKKTAEAPAITPTPVVAAAPAPSVVATPVVPSKAEAVKDAPAKATPVVAQNVPAGYALPAVKEPTDPYVRARMGLPKL